MTLDEQLKASGMLTVKELMEGQPIDGFMINTGIKDLETFSDWLEMRTQEMLKIKARMILKNREDEDIYEWVLAHCAILNEVRLNFNAANAK